MLETFQKKVNEDLKNNSEFNSANNQLNSFLNKFSQNSKAILKDPSDQILYPILIELADFYQNMNELSFFKKLFDLKKYMEYQNMNPNTLI